MCSAWLVLSGKQNKQLVSHAVPISDAQSIELLFRHYRRPLFQTALRILGNAEDAEDALQNGLLSAYRNVHRFQGRSLFSTWLTRIVINAALMNRRNAKAQPTVSLDEAFPEEDLPLSEQLADDGLNPEQVCAGTEIRAMINQGLHELSIVLQTAFLLREVEGYSTLEAAKTVGANESTLKCRVRRARIALAERLGPRLLGLEQSHKQKQRGEA